jgi:hypothetical protein
MELWVFFTIHQDRGLVHVCSVCVFRGEEVHSRWKHSVWWSGHACLCLDHCPMALGLLRMSSDDKGLVYMYNRPGFLVEDRSGMK